MKSDPLCDDSNYSTSSMPKIYLEQVQLIQTCRSLPVISANFYEMFNFDEKSVAIMKIPGSLTRRAHVGSRICVFIFVVFCCTPKMLKIGD